MSKLLNKLLIFICLFVSNGCEENLGPLLLTPVLIKGFPQEPITFQNQFGGEISYFSTPVGNQDKITSISGSLVRSDDFKAIFSSNTDGSKLLSLEARSNKIRLERHALIGLSQLDLFELIGPPSHFDEISGAPIFELSDTIYLSFGIRDGVVVRWFLGHWE